MDSVIENAGLVLSRAGASTCSELKTVGRPTVLTPLPNSAGDHQKHNAFAFVNENRGLMVEQGQGFEGKLFDALSSLMADENARNTMAIPEPNTAVMRCLDDLNF
jgi:UDP-N-acetylglucosamine--N-acetylmuramyl-(pentapeptide) pyrophosphoryl-undecaprenol N-acetylglucosamine transferase